MNQTLIKALPNSGNGVELGAVTQRLAAVAVTLALVAGACSSTSNDVVPTSTSEAAAPTATTAPITNANGLTVFDCEAPAEGWEAFCEAHRVILDEYVDEISENDLAAAAARGLEEFATEDALPAPPDAVACTAPSEPFLIFCEALADHMAEAPATAQDRVAAAIRGMISFGVEDPHSTYLSPEALELIRENQRGEVEGIGALVDAQDELDELAVCPVLTGTCRLVIVKPLDGSPAQEVGLQSGDVIVAVGGEPVEGLTIDEVVAQVRGPAGTDVRLGIERDENTFDVVITRQAITIPLVESELLDGNVGYIRLSLFAENSPEQFRTALEGLVEDGADSFIFDLQDNPGGTLTAAVAIASEFLDDGLVLRTEAPDEMIDYEVLEGGLLTDDSELVVLINRGSASASEVVAGALQETGRATIIGEASFGKNTVQRQFNLPNGGAVKLTIARWVTPDGNDFGQVGIEPDVTIELSGTAGLDVLIDQGLAWMLGR